MNACSFTQIITNSVKIGNETKPKIHYLACGCETHLETTTLHNNLTDNEILLVLWRGDAQGISTGPTLANRNEPETQTDLCPLP